MCTDVCHAQKLQNTSYTFDQIGYAINKSTYWSALVDKRLITAYFYSDKTNVVKITSDSGEITT